MKAPFLAITIDAALSQMTFTHVDKQDESFPRQKVSFTLQEFDDQGLDAACLQLGTMVLSVMTHGHPEVFARFPNLKLPSRLPYEVNLISTLIAKSMGTATTAHIPSIQLLVDQLIAADPMAKEDTTIKQWPETKTMLEGLVELERRAAAQARKPD